MANLRLVARSILSCCAFVVTAANAHVKFSPADASAGQRFTGTLTVGHGCAGSPTKRLRVRIPDGVIDVKPQEKPGWSMKIVVGRYAHPWIAGGRTFAEGVQEIIWAGRLPPKEHGAFTLQLRLADSLVSGARVLFPTVQECEKGVERWIDPSDDDEDPAPSLRVHAQP